MSFSITLLWLTRSGTINKIDYQPPQSGTFCCGGVDLTVCFGGGGVKSKPLPAYADVAANNANAVAQPNATHLHV
jgi:hypothetical protein